MPIDTSSYADQGVNKLLATAGNDPTQAFQTVNAAQQIGMNSQVMQLRDAQISQTQLDLAKSKLGAMNGVLGGIVANPTMENAQQRISDAVAAGVIDAPTAKAGLAQLMQTGGDPNNIKGWATDHLNQNANHQQLMDQAYGTSGTVNTGGSTVPVITRTGAQAGTTVGGGAPIPNTLNPGQKTSQVQYVDPTTGAGKSAPVGTMFDDQGNPRPAGYSVSPFGAVARGGQAGGTPPAGQAGQGGSSPPPQAAPISFGGAAPQAGAAPQGAGTSPQAGQGGGQPQGSAPQNGGQAQGAQPAMVTPTAQNMPVVTKAQADAATARVQAGQGSATDRNLMRGYLIQNNMTLPSTAKGQAFEPQPATPGATVSPQPAQGAVSPGRQPPPQVTGADAPPTGMAVQPGSDSGHLVRVALSPDSPFGAPTAPAPSPAGSGGVLTTSLSPGQSASIAAGANSYGALSTDASNPAGVNQRVFQLQTALNALRGTSTGLGTSGRQQLVGYLSSLPGGLAKNLPGVDADSATDYDIATKYLNAYALNTPGAARSDAGLSTAQSANANTSGMMQKAAQDVTLSNIGLEKGKLALLNSFNATGADPGTFGRFAAGWSQGNDPRAFALGDMTPPERAAMFNSLKGSQKAAFLSTVKKGLAAGVLSRNDLQGASGNGQ